MRITPDEKTIAVGDINSNISTELAAAASGTVVHVTNRGREHVSITATDEFRRMQHAVSALGGFLRLAARDADCSEYAAHAEDLVRLIRSGALAMPSDLVAEVMLAISHRAQAPA